MLHAPAERRAVDPVRLEHPLIDVQGFAVGAVADGMGVHLEAVPEGDCSGPFDVLYRFQQLVPLIG